MEQENKPNLIKSTMTSGAILGAVLLIYTLLLYMTGLTFSKGLGYVSWLFIIAGIVWGIKSFRDQNEGFISYGSALGVGMLTIVFASVIMALFNYILFSFIDPGLVEKGIEIARSQMVAKNNLTDDQIETAINISKKFMTPGFMAIMTIVSYAFFGLILSLIIAAFMKKEKSVFSGAIDNNQQ